MFLTQPLPKHVQVCGEAYFLSVVSLLDFVYRTTDKSPFI